MCWREGVGAGVSSWGDFQEPGSSALPLPCLQVCNRRGTEGGQEADLFCALTGGAPSGTFDSLNAFPTANQEWGFLSQNYFQTGLMPHWGFQSQPQGGYRPHFLKEQGYCAQEV